MEDNVKNAALTADQKKMVMSFLDCYPNIKKSKLTKSQKWILALLLSAGYNQNGTFTMGYKYISNALGINRKTVGMANDIFKRLKFYKCEKGYNGNNSKFTMLYDNIKAYDEELCDKMKMSHNTEMSHNNYEETSKQNVDLQQVMKMFDERFQKIENKLDELQKNENVTLSISISISKCISLILPSILYHLNVNSIISEDDRKKIIKEISKYMKHNDISSITSEEENNILKEMKDNEIIGPEVNVVANNENNGMNDNTTNNNIQPLQDLTSDTSDTSTVLLSGDGGIGGMVSSVEENNIQTVQVRTSDALDTPKFCSSGNEGMEVVSDSTNSESTATNGVDKTHTTSEDITIPTVNGSETLQHPTYSSAKPSKIYAKKGAAAVGGDGKGGAGRNISTSAEQLPTSTEKVDNIAPSYSDTASNGEFDMFYAQYGCTREEYEEAQRSFHKSNWRSLPCRFNGQELTMSKVIDKFNEENKEGKKPIETNTYFFILDALESRARYYERNGKMSQADTDDYLSVIRKKSGRYFTYWTKTFSERMPYEARPSEKRMYDLLVQMGIIGEEQSKKTDITSIPTVNTVDTDFEDEMAYLDFESGTMTKNTL